MPPKLHRGAKGKCPQGSNDTVITKEGGIVYEELNIVQVGKDGLITDGKTIAGDGKDKIACEDNVDVPGVPAVTPKKAAVMPSTSSVYVVELKKRKPAIASSLEEVQDFQKKYRSYIVDTKEFDTVAQAQTYCDNYTIITEPSSPSTLASTNSSNLGSPTSTCNSFSLAVKKKACNGVWHGYIGAIPFCSYLVFVWRFLAKGGAEKWCHRYDAVAQCLSAYATLKDDDKFQSVLRNTDKRGLIEKILRGMKYTVVRDRNGDEAAILMDTGRDKKEYKVFCMWAFAPNPKDSCDRDWKQLLKETTVAMKLVFGTQNFVEEYQKLVSDRMWKSMKGKEATYWIDLTTARLTVQCTNNLKELFVDSDVAYIEPRALGIEDITDAEEEEAEDDESIEE